MSETALASELPRKRILYYLIYIFANSKHCTWYCYLLAIASATATTTAIDGRHYFPICRLLFWAQEPNCACQAAGAYNCIATPMLGFLQCYSISSNACDINNRREAIVTFARVTQHKKQK